MRIVPVLASERTSTATQTAGCYAAALGDCHGKLTREHWISAAVLRLLTVDDHVPIRGLAWLRGESRSLPIAGLQAKILCAHHNSQLSPLDEVGLQWATSIGLVDAGATAIADLIDGQCFERWLLKLLCGLGSSGAAGRDGTALRRWTPPAAWLRVLFGHSVHQPGVGLYAIATPPRVLGPYLAATPFGSLDALAGLQVHVPRGRGVDAGLHPRFPGPHRVGALDLGASVMAGSPRSGRASARCARR